MSRARLVYEMRVRTLELLSHPLVVPFRAGAAWIVALAWRPLRPAAAFALLCRCHRILLLAAPNDRFCRWLAPRVERELRPACARGGLVESMSAAPARTVVVGGDAAGARRAGLVLKPPRHEAGVVVEKGVLLLKNSERLDSFRRLVEMGSLLEHYALVLEPSWSGYAEPRLLAFTAFRRHSIAVMSPCRADHDFLLRLGTNLRPIPIGASDWVDPRVFRPLADQPKQFDAVMVARWTLLKRHHLLFRAVRRIGDPSYRVALVAANIKGDRDRDVLRAMIGAYGLARQIEVFEDLEPGGVNEVLNQAKVNLLLSRQEGSNRSLFEGFFAGVPGLAFAHHVGLPTAHFNDQTGRLIAENDLVPALLHFRSHWSDFDPRPWALANIAPEVTAARLNLVLRQLAGERGESWRRDIAAKCNRPDLHYYPDDRSGEGCAGMEELLRRFSQRR